MSGFDERMGILRQRYAERAISDLEALMAALKAEDWTEVRRIAHGLAGTGAVFGFPELSDSARNLDDAIADDLPASERLRLGKALCSALRATAQER